MNRSHSSKHGVRESFSLHALLKNGARMDLLTEQTDRDLVLYIEYAIEEFLGIQDRPVSGEMPKTA